MEDVAALDIALDSVGLDELNSPEAKALLDTIDSLREMHVGEIVNLPQIIVVGDQSSGKSSVLEAISRVRFPTKGGLCTRFATELVLRRSPETKIGVRIDGATGAGSGSSQQFRRISFDKDALPEIINEAKEKMGIRVGSSKGFSKDILHVEIAGPDIYPVTLVDLPGFFHAETADQTPEDKQLVKELAESYMKQSKSIILTVISANQPLANQIVVDEAKRYDPNRERTVGIITKPDLPAPGSDDEKKCLQLIRGQESKHKLKLGWHVLRNRPEGQEETTADDRDAEEEKFFQSGAWSSIIPMSRGITSLRKKLSKVLLQHIQKTLPGLIEEIENGLSARQRAIEQLGKPRSKPDELRTYLLEIAERFQRLARDGIDGRYGDEFFGDLYNNQGTRKLRAVLRAFNRAFHATLVSKGMDREIEWDGAEGFSVDDGAFEWIQNGHDAPEYIKPFLDLFKDCPDPTRISETELRKELEELAAANQGTEYPGLPNGDLGFQLFKMQAKPWGGIADIYLDQVVDFAKVFVEDLFIHIIGADKQTTNAVLVLYVSRFFEERRKLLKEKLQEILRPYVSVYAPPLDAAFHAALSSMVTRREAERVVSLLEAKFPAAFTDKAGKGLTHEEVEEAISSAGAAKASEFGTDKIVGMTMTHFKVQKTVSAVFD
ncbi:putative dynamin family protein [Emericellopsis cladophorae]|uniref:Dynamin family protein n=1 Tax=Emericellopsis cladophorae TaxID=2686198 RepID=A0A9P9XVL6_9HYPO|nr:putative dynamin family protein [Emericellopsis cladophorae]KAI6778501.1 putative dynamin family protein [Emericellopsis cladophorae]